MNLKSCDGCGVVFDLNKLPFPDDIYDEEGCIDKAKAVWVSGSKFAPFINCPICNAIIDKSDD